MEGQTTGLADTIENRSKIFVNSRRRNSQLLAHGIRIVRSMLFVIHMYEGAGAARGEVARSIQLSYTFTSDFAI